MKKIVLIILILLLTLSLTSCTKTVSGNITFDGIVKDDEFNIEVEAPILYRLVQMVQYANDNGEMKMVLSNANVSSFEISGTKYENPEFPIESKFFIATSYLDNIEIDFELLKEILLSKLEDSKVVTTLDIPMGNKNNLVIIDNSYVTASNDYEVGDIKITYYYLPSDLIFKISTEEKDNKLILTNNTKIE